jgi:hypothetical protein
MPGTHGCWEDEACMTSGFLLHGDMIPKDDTYVEILISLFIIVMKAHSVLNFEASIWSRICIKFFFFNPQ